MNIPMNKKWAAWIKTLTGSGKLDDYGLFIEFFQCIQVRSMSEAMAETVFCIEHALLISKRTRNLTNGISS